MTTTIFFDDEHPRDFDGKLRRNFALDDIPAACTRLALDMEHELVLQRAQLVTFSDAITT